MKISLFNSDHYQWNYYLNHLIADEISSLTRYYDRVIQWLPRKEDSGLLFKLIQGKNKKTVSKEETFPDLSHERDFRTAILLNGTINHHFDIQGLLMDLKSSLSRGSRILAVAYNPYLSWLYRFASFIGLRKGEIPMTFVTKIDLQNIVKLAGYTIVRIRPVGYFPWFFFGIGHLLNRLMVSIPFLRWLSFAYLVVLRPIIADPSSNYSLSCVIPARNEKGNIENALKRMPKIDGPLEIIFVEGHSTDGTWEEILRVCEKFKDQYQTKCFQQTGKRKSDAVRLGFSKATGDLLTILDADLTMPPEYLNRYYNAYREGLADFINGSRLVYPMEKNAMRFLNRLGNIFFAKMLSWVLDERIGDSLCGTKLFLRSDYSRMVKWREDFGEFDPFGDFELLFPAAMLGLGIIDIPVRYLDRTYGSTNISRFKHGFMLLKMTLIGFFRIRMGARFGRP